MTNARYISAQQAYQKVNNSEAQFVDIRTPSEISSEELPDALLIPFDLINSTRLRKQADPGKNLIIVCRSGSRAKQAATALSTQMSNIEILEDGIAGWKKQGLPLQTGPRIVPLERQVLIGVGTLVFLFTFLGLTTTPYFFGVTLFMACGMVFAGVTGACGIARLLVFMPWNSKPLCGDNCQFESSGAQQR